MEHWQGERVVHGAPVAAAVRPVALAQLGAAVAPDRQRGLAARAVLPALPQPP